VKKVTYSLDDETVAHLDRMAKRLSKPKSRVVREAIRYYGEEMDRMTAEERDRMLEVFDEVTSKIPSRSRTDVNAELEEVRKARRSGGRRTTEKARP
jgi:predicted DNA-binding protein